MTPPTSRSASAAIARRCSKGGNASEPNRSNESSARVSAVLTDWPPGPGDLENRQVSSSGGIVMPRTTTSRLIPAASAVRVPLPRSRLPLFLAGWRDGQGAATTGSAYHSGQPPLLRPDDSAELTPDR